MPVEKIDNLIKIKIIKSEIERILKEKFDSYGYGGCDILIMPHSTRIFVYVVNLARALEVGNKKRIILENEFKEKFKLMDPRIEFKEIENPFLNAYVVARRIGRAIERGIDYKKAANYYLDKVMESGAIGCLIKVSGKIMGKERSASQKFKDGYILHSGNYEEVLVDKAHYRATIPHGIIGISVKILKQAPIEFVFEKKLEDGTS
ncbi:MAG: 30S ribosomal protein S3 [Candidatus Aenigmarchaeota archaeon]|nr:30S ribosomal protein S3 [Candidatus Aenigmarchaeota archaeon]MDW8149754.1 30S ribosomal protein S3 [Candidatus Aenigmarchaeota archaeon]